VNQCKETFKICKNVENSTTTTQNCKAIFAAYQAREASTEVVLFVFNIVATAALTGTFVATGWVRKHGKNASGRIRVLYRFRVVVRGPMLHKIELHCNSKQRMRNLRNNWQMKKRGI
jgi:hypothetical protein